MLKKLTRIVGGLGSECVQALLITIHVLIIDSKDTARVLELAKTTLYTEMGARFELKEKHIAKHVAKLLEALEPPAVEEVEVDFPEIDMDALLSTSMDDIDLDDEALTPEASWILQLLRLGDDMAYNYSVSNQAFWLERVTVDNRSFLGVGTSSGPHSRFPDQDFNVFCTTNGCRSIKDADDELVVYHDGRQLTRGKDRDGRAYFIRFLPLDTCRTWRFWASTNKNGMRRDVADLKFTIKLDPNEPKGYVRIQTRQNASLRA
jgi:hypothetical protein